MLMQLLDQLQKKAATMGMVQRTAINTVLNLIPKTEIYLLDHRIGLLVQCIENKDHPQIDNFCEAYDIPDDSDLRKYFHRLALAAVSPEEREIRKQKEREVETRFTEGEIDTEPLIPITPEQELVNQLNHQAADSGNGMMFFASEDEMNQHIKEQKQNFRNLQGN